MSDLADLQHEQIQTLELDVSSDDSVAKAVDFVMSRCGKIDILINNAGIGSTGPLAELPLDVIKRAYEINALGQLRMVQGVVPHMVARGGGSIVNIGSVVGKVPTPWAGSYCASKGLKDYDWRIYKNFKDTIAERARASQSGKSTDATVFARHVASRVLSSSPPKTITSGQ
ncbi:3-oxoacyl-[acyl-carrier-protein] reductase FabG [Sesamum angolense]|uniref:3-oxoacyl-[acyl-carrier-protein] reductase FabG n=1 Tax=Sesamum angolense TaxID=2727404 RepID=A0AAE1T8Z8_9LAMI|nr:3-oxoacyl-[acyl-carrier-protein] reductase FabG [Sesamum angolense]